MTGRQDRLYWAGGESYAHGMSGSRARTTRKASQGVQSGRTDAVAEWVDGVPYIPDDEMDAAVEVEAADWSELLRRLAE